MEENLPTFFENHQLLNDALPKAAEINFEHVSEEHKTVQFIWLTVFSVIVLLTSTGIIASTGNILNLSVWGIVLVGIALIIAFFSLMISLGFKHRGYSVREHDIAYKSGVLFRSQTTVPLVKLQHCEIGQGPFERMFNLAHLNLYTAGGMNTEISVKGLTVEKGEKLREYILDKLKNLDKKAHE